MKCVRCRRCFFFSEPSSGEPLGSETEAFSESGDGGGEQGHRASRPERILGFWNLLNRPLALTQAATQGHTRLETELFCPTSPGGGVLTAVLLALAAVFWERRMRSAGV